MSVAKKEKKATTRSKWGGGDTFSENIISGHVILANRECVVSCILKMPGMCALEALLEKQSYCGSAVQDSITHVFYPAANRHYCSLF